MKGDILILTGNMPQRPPPLTACEVQAGTCVLKKTESALLQMTSLVIIGTAAMP